MAFKRDNELNFDQISAFLKDAVEKVESNPELYEELKKVFKKSVPLTRRSYVAAYLLKCASGSIYRFSSQKSREDYRNRRDDARRSRFENRKNENNDSSEVRERFQRIQIDPELASTIFVGIGRNRRVFPRDIVGLFTNVAGIERERIGAIKVLANYSFVELFKDDADKVINSLNGYDYRGRKLAVSYSSKKDSEDAIDIEDNDELVPDVENTSAPVIDSFTATNTDTVAQQAAFAKAMENSPIEEMSDEEIMALRAPRSSSSDDIQ